MDPTVAGVDPMVSSLDEAPPRTAVVAAGDEETRLLLRGLLRLHRFRIVGEAPGATEGLQLVQTQHPTVLVADVNLAEGSVAHLLEGARASPAPVRVVLVLPAQRAVPPTPGVAGPDAVLYRPFRIKQFLEAVDPGDDGTEVAA